MVKQGLERKVEMAFTNKVSHVNEMKGSAIKTLPGVGLWL